MIYSIGKGKTLKKPLWYNLALILSLEATQKCVFCFNLCKDIDKKHDFLSFMWNYLSCELYSTCGPSYTIECSRWTKTYFFTLYLSFYQSIFIKIARNVFKIVFWQFYLMTVIPFWFIQTKTFKNNLQFCYEYIYD